MTLNDLLQNRFTRVLGTLAALAVPAGLACEADEGSPVYPPSSQSASQPCYSDNECKGERICVSGYCQDSTGNNIPGNSNGSTEEIYGSWKKLKEITTTGIKEYGSTPTFPLVIFEKCSDGFDKWIEYEDDSCNYSDGGLFTHGPDWLNTTISTYCKQKEPPYFNVDASHIDLYEMLISSETLTLTDDSGHGPSEIVFKRYAGNTDFCPGVCSQGTLYFDETNPSQQYPCE